MTLTPSGPHVSDDTQHDVCNRCGRPTPLGVSLCDADNPARLSGPSTTQMHATVLIGVVLGFVGLAFAARMLTAGVGPFQSAVVGQVADPGGSVQLVVRVTNLGTREAAAACRVGRGPTQMPGDDVFLTPVRIPAGESRDFERSLPAPTGDSSAAIAVRCT